MVNFKRGYDLPEKNRVHGDVPVVSSAGLSGYHNQYKAEGEGLVTGRYGTLGKMHFVNGKYWPHNTALYATDFKGNYPKYVYYLLTCLGNLKTSDKTSVPGINRNDLHELNIPYLKPDDQIEPADLLWSIDQKIELNNKINAELEAMAKLIYDYWFVQFDFPDENGKPYKSSGGKMVFNKELKREIPDGWNAVRVENLTPVVTGKEDANFATEDGEFHFFTCAEETSRCDKPAFNGHAVLLAGNGSLKVKYYSGRFNAYQRTYVLIPLDAKMWVPIYFAVSDRIKALTSGSRGSIVKFITKGDVADILLPLPTESNKLDFSLLQSIFESILLRQNENQELATLRDWLLPMLMNGQVKVGAGKGVAKAAEPWG